VTPSLSPYQSLSLYLKQLHLSHRLKHWENLEQQATQEGWSYAQFLLALSTLEVHYRWNLRLARALSEAQLPNAKTVSNFEWTHVPKLNPAPIMQLVENSAWLDGGENCLIFRASGVGKTHLAAGIGRSMVEFGKRVKFY